jgi:threonine/homoserine/homoserine lactone efflux protein
VDAVAVACINGGMTSATTHAIVTFTAAAGVLTITPGLDTALVLRTAAVEGPRRAFRAGLGICVGCLVWGLAAAVGLGALLAASRLGYRILQMAGAVYLVQLGVRMLLRREPPDATLAVAAAPGARWFVRGLLGNLLNPKVGVFYVSFLPLFIPQGVNVAGFGVLLASIHAAEGILWFATLIAATRTMAHWFARPRVKRALDRTTGLVLLAFGLRLALDRRR